MKKMAAILFLALLSLSTGSSAWETVLSLKQAQTLLGRGVVRLTSVAACDVEGRRVAFSYVASTAEPPYQKDAVALLERRPDGMKTAWTLVEAGQEAPDGSILHHLEDVRCSNGGIVFAGTDTERRWGIYRLRVKMPVVSSRQPVVFKPVLETIVSDRGLDPNGTQYLWLWGYDLDEGGKNVAARIIPANRVGAGIYTFVSGEFFRVIEGDTSAPTVLAGNIAVSRYFERDISVWSQKNGLRDYPNPICDGRVWVSGEELVCSGRQAASSEDGIYAVSMKYGSVREVVPSKFFMDRGLLPSTSMDVSQDVVAIFVYGVGKEGVMKFDLRTGRERSSFFTKGKWESNSPIDVKGGSGFVVFDPGPKGGAIIRF